MKPDDRRGLFAKWLLTIESVLKENMITMKKLNKTLLSLCRFVIFVLFIPIYTVVFWSVWLFLAAPSGQLYISLFYISTYCHCKWLRQLGHVMDRGIYSFNIQVQHGRRFFRHPIREGEDRYFSVKVEEYTPLGMECGNLNYCWNWKLSFENKIYQ